MTGCSTAGPVLSRRRVFGVACLLALAPVVVAADNARDAHSSDLMLEAVVTGVNPATGRDGSTYAVRAYVGADRTRIDLDVPGAERAYLLLDNASGQGWAISKDSDAALPVSIDSYRELVVDPAAPCAGMQVRCDPLGHRDMAGVRARGLRYTGARGRGPGGSDRGELWIDPDTGIVLGYDARTRDGAPRRLRATGLRREALPAALFELPAPLRSR